jgi:signal transduction histidine kinase
MRADGLGGYVEGVLRSVTARLAQPDRSAATSPWPARAGLQVPVILNLVRILVLVVVLVTVPLAEPELGSSAQGTAIAVALGVSAVAWLVWMIFRNRESYLITSLVVMGAAGGVLAGLSPLSTAIAVGCVVTSSAGAGLEAEKSLAITTETVAAFLITGLLTGAPTETLVGYPLTFIGLWAFGLTRHAYVLRAEQAERMLAETRRAHDAETAAAALAERARIARDIHDVLAHSLAAVSVNLEAAEGLLGALPPDQPELVKAIECIERAGAFTRDGMAEARRAILALRDNAAPLPDQMSELATEYSADGDTPVDFAVTGAPRPVPADVSLTAFRTAQEALTNARKHAPGEHVSLRLEFAPAEIEVHVANPLPDVAADRPLAAAGAGHGLTGLRERAALGGGSLTAGPQDGQWQVRMRIPT